MTPSHPKQPSSKPKNAGSKQLNAMTVDVEDWYQVSAFEDIVSRDDWDTYESRVVANTTRLVALFARYECKATFFTLGWVAERFPDLVRAIHDAGHEVASHGYEHRLVYSMTPEAFRADLERAREALEAAAPGVDIRGFRAPSFSVRPDTPWAWDVLRDLGYTYSSSIFPVRHDRYGIPSFPRRPVRLKDNDGAVLWEFPMTTLRVFGRNLPASGGGWMRLLPLGVVRRAIRRANAKGDPAIVYLHPWEVDPGQPRLSEASRATRFRHTVNLDKMEKRLERLLQLFRFGTVSSVLETLTHQADVLDTSALHSVLEASK